MIFTHSMLFYSNAGLSFEYSTLLEYNSPKIPSDELYINLKEMVSRKISKCIITELPWDSNDTRWGNQSVIKRTFRFSPNANLTESSSVEISGQTPIKSFYTRDIVYQYNANNFLSKEIFKSSIYNDTIINNYHYQINTDSNYISLKFDSIWTSFYDRPDTTTIENDEEQRIYLNKQGKIVRYVYYNYKQQNYPNRNIIENYFYDKNNLTKSIVPSWESGTFFRFVITNYKYKNGKLSERVVGRTFSAKDSLDEKKMDNIYKYVYDNNGRLIKIINSLPKDSVTYFYENHYDKQGQLILKTISENRFKKRDIELKKLHNSSPLKGKTVKKNDTSTLFSYKYKGGLIEEIKESDQRVYKYEYEFYK